jgi:hypothetical protein
VLKKDNDRLSAESKAAKELQSNLFHLLNYVKQALSKFTLQAGGTLAPNSDAPPPAAVVARNGVAVEKRRRHKPRKSSAERHAKILELVRGGTNELYDLFQQLSVSYPDRSISDLRNDLYRMRKHEEIITPDSRGFSGLILAS